MKTEKMMESNENVFSFSSPDVKGHFQAKITLKDQIREHAEAATKQYSCHVTDIKVISRIEKVQLYIARDDMKPMGINECAKINSEFCKLLDVYLPKVREKFNIEVISAGLDRVIKTPQEFQHAIKQRANITFLKDEEQFYNTFYLLAYSENEVHLIQESNLFKAMKNAEILKFFKDYLKTHKKTFNKKSKDSVIRDAFVDFLSHILDNSGILTENQLKTLNEICKFTTLHTNNIVKAKLAPLFD